MSTNTHAAIDAARLSLLLNELRLPAIKNLWPAFAEQADKEGWPAARSCSPLRCTNRLRSGKDGP